MKKLYNLKRKEGGVMSNHLNEFNTLASQLVSVGITLDDEMKAILLLCSLPNSWEGVVMAVSTSVAAKTKLNFDEVAATLLSEYMRRKNQESSFGDALIAVSTSNRGRSREQGQHNNNGRSKSAHHSKSRGRNGTCWFCGKPGHTKKKCWNYKKAQNKVINDGVNTTAAKDDGVLVLAAGDTNASSWVLDSGASFHVTPCRSAFTNYQVGSFGKVFLGDNKECFIVGKGDVLLSLKNGKQWILKDVRHVPTLKRNLISVSQLYAQGCNVNFSLDSWKVTKGVLVLAKGKKLGSLYVLECNNEVGVAMAVTDSNTELWHKRLGHMSKKGLEVMLR